MKHKRNFITIAVVTLVLGALCAVCVSPVSVSAAGGGTQTQASSAPVWPAGEGGLAVCSGSGYFYVFAKGPDPDRDLKYQEWTSASGWLGWHSLGGVMDSESPAAVCISHGSGIYDQELFVVVRGLDGAAWYIHSSTGGATWDDWQSLGGVILERTSPTICSWGWQTHVFVTGTDGALYHKWLDTSWHPSQQGMNWENDGGYLTWSPAANARADRVLDIFARGSDGALWRLSYDHGWKSWDGFGGEIRPGSGPAVCSYNNWLFVFVQGMDKALWGRSLTVAWSGWWMARDALGNPDGGWLKTSPAAATSATTADNAHIAVYVRGSDWNIWEKAFWFGEWRWGAWYPATFPSYPVPL